MTGIEGEPSLGWGPEPLRIELSLSDLMADLDPRWNEWGALESVAS